MLSRKFEANQFLRDYVIWSLLDLLRLLISCHCLIVLHMLGFHRITERKQREVGEGEKMEGSNS
uniref:Uncharacterized protein n=1 Tax=Onchocerca volvulus TaxID=6282 RepID=A0A8R1XXA0_ONCVO